MRICISSYFHQLDDECLRPMSWVSICNEWKFVLSTRCFFPAYFYRPCYNLKSASPHLFVGYRTCDNSLLKLERAEGNSIPMTPCRVEPGTSGDKQYSSRRTQSGPVCISWCPLAGEKTHISCPRFSSTPEATLIFQWLPDIKSIVRSQNPPGFGDVDD